MHHIRRYLNIILLPVIWFLLLNGTNCLGGENIPAEAKLDSILAAVTPALKQELAAKKLELGAPVFIRIFKLQGQLEVWMQQDDIFKLFKTYRICSYSGYLGPKQHEGDWQSPEGFYMVTPKLMNPGSSYHLAFNIGYPNDYDMFLQRDGGDIMVHGGCSSMGCFAMSNHRMEEIYALAHYAFLGGQESFAVHIFPFRMTEENLNRFHFSPWIGFWKNMQEGYIAFEKNRQVPLISAEKGKYIVEKPLRLASKSREQ